MIEMLAVDENLVKKAGEDGSVIWYDPNEDAEEPIISIFSNETGHFSFSNLPFTKEDGASPLSMEQLKEKAFEYLELAEGNIHDKFVLEEPIVTVDNEPLYTEQVMEEDEDMDEEDVFLYSEPTQMFTFNREYAGYRIEGREAHIHVGLYTGIIRECSVTCLSPDQTASMEKLDMKPAITLQEAEDRFFSEIEMKLARCVKTMDDPSVYTLSYLVDFPATSGHIEKINAHTGEVSYIETGILKESD
jgi:nitrogen fixation protein